jgi:hypothetical protein
MYSMYSGRSKVQARHSDEPALPRPHLIPSIIKGVRIMTIYCINVHMA